MPDVNDIHLFYEANLPEYKRKHLLECNKFFLQLMGIHGKPIALVLKNFQWFKEVVCYEWLGADDIYERPLPKPKKEKPEEEFIMTYGKHKGMNMKDVAPDYLEWLVKNNRASDSVKRFVKLKNKK